MRCWRSDRADSFAAAPAIGQLAHDLTVRSACRSASLDCCKVLLHKTAVWRCIPALDLGTIRSKLAQVHQLGLALSTQHCGSVDRLGVALKDEGTPAQHCIWSMIDVGYINKL